MNLLKGYVVPGLPQPLLTPKANESYGKLRAAFDRIKEELEVLKPDVILIYSTMWPSILGHQIQAKETLKWIHVDEEFHDLGSIPYEFKIDRLFALEYVKAATERGLLAKEVNYHGFPVDTGSVVTLKLVNPDNKFSAVIVSSNIYSDRAETVVLAKAAKDVLKKQGKTAVAIIVSTLSNRLHADFTAPKDDKIHSLKDNEWNLKILEFLGAGRLEDVAQLSRQIHKEARVKKVNNFKPFWWLSSLMGAHNRYKGEVFAYEPIYGVGGAVVSLTPTEFAARDLEFDEDSPEVFQGDRNVLESQAGLSSQTLNPGQMVEEDEEQV